MTAYQSRFLKTLHERGFIHQVTDAKALDDLLSKEQITGYIGFDCTASSLHVGSLVQIMLLRWLQKTGHKVIVLMGGGTTKIGDPSGKDEARQLLDDTAIGKNKAGIQKIFERYLDKNFTMVDNDEWLSKLNYIDFLRDYGRFFSINVMLAKDSVKLRLEREQHLSFLEFNYMILQAYDFVELFKRYNCRLQMGGSDQWGNITAGTDLARHVKRDEINKEAIVASDNENLDLYFKLRERTGDSATGIDTEDMHKNLEKNANNFTADFGVFGLTSPLLTTSSGAKMGKTAAGAVWLNADMLSPYDFWQYWRNTEDADVGRFLKLFTELPMEEIAKLEKLEGAKINEAKIILANEVTKLCHGDAAAKEAEATARKVFEQGGIGEELPEIMIAKSQLEAGIPAFQLFKDAGLAESGGEAKRLVQGGGAKVNDVKVEKPDQLITVNDVKNGIIKLSAGKKRHAVVKVG